MNTVRKSRIERIRRRESELLYKQEIQRIEKEPTTLPNVVKKIIQKTTKSTQETLLLTAAKLGRTKAVRCLIKYGSPDLEVKNNSGDTALIVAAKHHKTETLHTLVELGADVRAKNKEERTALSYLKKSRHFVEKLEEIILQQIIIPSLESKCSTPQTLQERSMLTFLNSNPCSTKKKLEAIIGVLISDHVPRLLFPIKDIILNKPLVVFYLAYREAFN